MPLLSSILGFLPYFLFAWAAFKKQFYITACFAFAYLLFVPIGFQLITSVPRGYLPACAFASIGIYIALFTKSKYHIFWFVFTGLVAFVCSQNAAFLVVPVAIYLFLHEGYLLKFYKQILAGIIAALPLPLLVYWFYTTHPACNMHQIELNFDLDSFLEFFKNTNTWFNYFSPFPKHHLLVVLLPFLVFPFIAILKYRVRTAISIVVALIFFLFTLTFDKAQDGTETPFYSSVRIFLGLPLSYIIFSAWSESAWTDTWIYKIATPFLLGIMTLTSIYCFYQRNAQFDSHLYVNFRRPDMVLVDRVSYTKSTCDSVAQICKDNHASLVVVDSAHVDVDYMAPALNYAYTTMVPDYERRTWVMQKEDTTIRDYFIYMPTDKNKRHKKIPSYAGSKIVCENPFAIRIDCHGHKVFEILADMKVDIRPH